MGRFLFWVVAIACGGALAPYVAPAVQRSAVMARRAVGVASRHRRRIAVSAAAVAVAVLALAGIAAGVLVNEKRSHWAADSAAAVARAAQCDSSARHETRVTPGKSPDSAYNPYSNMVLQDVLCGGARR